MYVYMDTDSSDRYGGELKKIFQLTYSTQLTKMTVEDLPIDLSREGNSRDEAVPAAVSQLRLGDSVPSGNTIVEQRR